MKIPSKALILATKAVATVKKYSPQIMMAVGAVTSVAAVVEAVKQTPKAMDILEKHREEMEKNKEALELGREDYTQKEYKINTGKIYLRTGKELAKVYFMPIVMETTSLMCFFGAHRVMSVRNKNLTVALATTTDAFNNYRNRVIEELGEDKEEKIAYGLKDVTIEDEIIDENGKEKKIKRKEKAVTVPELGTIYDFFWGENDPGFDQSRELCYLRINANAGYVNKMIWGHEDGRDAAEEYNIAKKPWERKRGIVPFMSQNDIRKLFLSPQDEGTITEDGQFIGVDKDHPDGYVSFKAIPAIKYDDPENPSQYREGFIIRPNYAGSILKHYRIEER